MPNQEERICCPKCGWQPDGGAYWACHCGHLWNTFETYGKCPACFFVHKDTQCPACHLFSPHPDWYMDLDGISLDMENMTKNKGAQGA